MKTIDWIINVKNAIVDISDIEWQKMAWLGLLPNVVSSPDETIMRLIDDLSFEDFIYDKRINQVIKKREIFNEFVTLLGMLKDYNTDGKSEIFILEDLHWLNITFQAKKIISLCTARK